MEKVSVLDDWLRFDEIQDLDYDVVHELNEYHDDDDDGDDMESVVEQVDYWT